MAITGVSDMRKRQFKLKGKSQPFELYGIGWNKMKLREAAQVIRNRGWYARVIPTRKDKDVGMQRYGVFIRPNRKQISINQVFSRHGFDKPISTDTPFHPSIPHQATNITGSGWYWNSPDVDKYGSKRIPSTTIFNKEIDEDDDERQERELREMMAKNLGMSQDEMTNIEEDLEDKNEWWEGKFWNDPLKRGQEDFKKELKKKRFPEKAAGRRGDMETNPMIDGVEWAESSDNWPEGEISEERAEEIWSENNDYNSDMASEMMDDFGFNDSAYPGMAPLTMIGYGNARWNKLLSKKEYKTLMDQSEKYHEEYRKQAAGLLGGTGRFSKLNEYVDDLAEPDWMGDATLALPIITVKYSSDIGSNGLTDDPNSEIDQIHEWYLHPKATEILLDGSEAVRTGKKPKYPAETNFIMRYGGDYFGEQAFTENVEFGYDMLDERISTSIEQFYLEGTETKDDLIIVGTDIGFFKPDGSLAGIRITPKNENILSGSPPFLKKLFSDLGNFDEGDYGYTDSPNPSGTMFKAGINGVSQLYWRGRRIWGSDEVGDFGAKMESELEDENLDLTLDRIQGAYTPAEIAIKYGFGASSITPSEANDFLAMVNQIGELLPDRNTGIDWNFYDTDDAMDAWDYLVQTGQQDEYLERARDHQTLT